MDHDHYKVGSLTPSVLLMGEIPEDAGDSWYGGQVYVDLRDSALAPSEPFLHAANLLQYLTKEAAAEGCPGEYPDYLWLSFDGGADRNNKHLKVKTSLIALWRMTKIKKLSAQRGAPYQSYTLTGERPMSLLQLGLIGVSLARGEMDEHCEEMVKGCKSMADLRYRTGVGPPPKDRNRGRRPKRARRRRRSAWTTGRATSSRRTARSTSPEHT